MLGTWRPNRNPAGRSTRRLKPITVMVVAGVLAAACGSASTAHSGGTANTGKIGGKLLIDNESGSTWTCQFNPFNPSVNITSIGFIYEPLEFINILQTNPDGTPKVTPWLATGSSWSADFKTLTMTIRSGVKWSDGSPFTANDVVYTFNALKADPALDLNALWSVDSGPLTNVALQGTNQVVFTFNAPAQSYFYYVADQTPIIPAAHLGQPRPEQARHRTRCRSRWNGPVSHVELLAGQHQIPAQHHLLAEHAGTPGAAGRGGRLSRRSSATPRRTCTSRRARRSGAPSTSPTSSPTTSTRARRRATTGSHRPSTSRSSRI